MKWTILVLSLLVVFSNHLKTAAQTSNNETMSLPTSVLDINMTSSDLPIMSTSFDTINITDMSATVTVDTDMNTTDMTLTVDITNTLVAIDSTPTSPSTFTMTITTDVLVPPTMMPTTSSMVPSSSPTEPTSSSTTITSITTTTTTTTDPRPSPTDGDGDDAGLGTGVIIGIAAGGGAAFLVVLVIFIICCCCCYQKRHREESYNIGPTVTARYWDANHNDAGPGHVTSGGSMRSRTSWRDSLRSFTRGSLRRSLSLRRSSKRGKDKQQPSEYIGLYSTPL